MSLFSPFYTRVGDARRLFARRVDLTGDCCSLGLNGARLAAGWSAAHWQGLSRQNVLVAVAMLEPALPVAVTAERGRSFVFWEGPPTPNFSGNLFTASVLGIDTIGLVCLLKSATKRPRSNIARNGATKDRFVGIRTRIVSQLLEKLLRVELPYRTADRSSEARSPG